MQWVGRVTGGGIAHFGSRVWRNQRAVRLV